MRIISGIHKGKRLNPPKNLPVRPTTDFAKEGLFNVLNNKIDFEACKVLDLFSGTGNISLEFASREAISVTSVDMNFKCVDFLRKTSEALKLQNIRPIKANVFKFLSSVKGKFDVVFADPPYDLNDIESIPNLVFENNFLEEDGLLILEHSRNYSFEDHPHFSEHRKYGNVNFSIFVK